MSELQRWLILRLPWRRSESKRFRRATDAVMVRSAAREQGSSVAAVLRYVPLLTGVVRTLCTCRKWSSFGSDSVMSIHMKGFH